MWRSRSAFRRNFPELADELFASGGAPPCLVVWVDCWTSLGGSQFLDSPGTGRYHTYLCDEVVPFVDERFRTLAVPQHRGIAGKSSGGYGAMVTAMLRPELFGGLATHAGDALFETCYLPGFRVSARTLRDEYEGSFERFWQEFRSRPAMSKDGDGELMNDWCMAACYSTDDDGTRDEWFLDLGAEAFRRSLEEIGVTDVSFEIFDAGHMAIEYRYPLSLKYLAERLAPAAAA